MKEIIRLAKESIRGSWKDSDGTFTMGELTNVVINQLTDELSDWARNIDDSCLIHGGIQGRRV